MPDHFPERHELKYRLTPEKAARLTAAVRGILRGDEHAGAADSSYLVQSLYFDNARLDGYRGKLAGLGLRAKLRLRTYGDASAGAYLELKRKRGPLIAKSRLTLPASAPWRGSGIDFLDWVRRELCGSTLPAWRRVRPDPGVDAMLLWPGLRPIAVVSYDRVAFGAGGPAAPRVTFDYDIRGTPSDRLQEHPTLRPAFAGVVILELKFTGPMPAFMAALIRGFHLELEAISKYARVVEAIAPVFPSESGRSLADEGITFPDSSLLYFAPRRHAALAGRGPMHAPPASRYSL